ncbi:MAG: hypothetical protein IPL63_14170 [Saprospiraceae bacterium]|nr:hypothetical protein [Saprospiraceae bacterium]
MKIFTLLIITIFYQYNVVGQCKSITSYKYKNVDEVIIYSPLLRCSKGISDHVSHQFSNYQNNYFIKTSVELSSVRDVLKFNEMVYVYTLGNGKVVEKTVNKKHKPIEGVVSNSLSDVSSTLEDIAVLASLLGGGSYSGTPQQKLSTS